MIFAKNSKPPVTSVTSVIVQVLQWVKGDRAGDTRDRVDFPQVAAATP